MTINPAAHNIAVSVQILGLWRCKARTASVELNALMDRIDANATVIGKAILLIRSLKHQLDQAIASGQLAPLRAFSASMGEESHALAHGIAGPHGA